MTVGRCKVVNSPEDCHVSKRSEAANLLIETFLPNCSPRRCVQLHLDLTKPVVFALRTCAIWVYS